MREIEYRTIDKSAWPAGPWRAEPDKMQWADVATGLPCLIVRGPMGALCGYVGVDRQHPWHGIDYSRPIDGTERVWSLHEDHPSPESSVEVHGGLTFSAACGHGSDENVGICHLPDPGEPDDVWWFGFDCAHLGDLAPGRSFLHRTFWPDEDETYKDMGYVKDQCRALARQLADAAS